MTTIHSVAEWIRANGLATAESWTAADLEKIAAEFKGKVHSTGGGIEVVLIELESGDVIGVSEECVQLYKKNFGDTCAEDVFWTNDADESQSIYFTDAPAPEPTILLKLTPAQLDALCDAVDVAVEGECGGDNQAEIKIMGEVQEILRGLKQPTAVQK